MPPHQAVISSHLVDHVHLNEEGYTLFAEELWRNLQEMDASHITLLDPLNVATGTAAKTSSVIP